MLVKSKVVENNDESSLPQENLVKIPSNEKRKHAKPKIGRIHAFRSVSRIIGNIDVFSNETKCPGFSKLNALVLRDLEQIIQKKPAEDLSYLLTQYIGHINSILICNKRILESRNSLNDKFNHSCKPSYSQNKDLKLDELQKHHLKYSAEVKFFSKQHTINELYVQGLKNTKYTEAYLALCSLYNINPLKKVEDSLTTLLEQSFVSEEDHHSSFKYLKVEDVIKTKGDSIYGPRREDIGKYNRKLFEMQTSDLCIESLVFLSVNPLFFKETSSLAVKHEIIECEHINLEYFSHGLPIKIGNFMIIIFKDNSKVLSTIKNADQTLFDGIYFENVQSSYKPGSKIITFLYLETFILYNIIFNSDIAAKKIYEKFFV